MLELKRLRYFTDFLRDTLDDRIIGPGEYYYEDPDDGTIISCEHYWELKKEKMENDFDDSWYNYMESEKDYKERLRQAQQQLKSASILNRDILGKKIEGI